MLHEECGVFGIYSTQPAPLSGKVYLGLFALQHRGQESCGIVVNSNGNFKSCKDLGLVSDVFNSEKLEALGNGSMAVGHVRYGTTGANIRANVQPPLPPQMSVEEALERYGSKPIDIDEEAVNELRRISTL